jgi:acetyltransferase
MNTKIVKELIDPQSIVVVGGSNNVSKPGGKLIKNILEGTFKGELYAVNPKENKVQGIKSYSSVSELPNTDLAILAIPAKFCTDTVRILAKEKQTKAFIIVSAGFSEESEEGRKIEEDIVRIIEEAGGSLIGPNCIGVMTPHYQGVFTLPIPKLSPDGCDFISGSGATAVFIMESGKPKGLKFSSVFSVGNSAQAGVEDMIEYLDNSFDPEKSARNKILYIESIKKPEKLMKHSASLIKKGCRIAAIKAGSSEAGSRAASSHTGALASSDKAVDALFKKAGIVRCYGREELSTVAGVFSNKKIEGRNCAIITHAGGPAVMLTDVLSEGGFHVPKIEGSAANELLEMLFPGSSVSNPIDILATGTADQVEKCIDYCENRFDNIDNIIIIFGSSGLTEVFDVYDVIHEKMKTCTKPIFPVMPSISTAGKEIESFRDKGNIVFYDEVELGNAICRTANTPAPSVFKTNAKPLDARKLDAILKDADSGYLDEDRVFALLKLAGIPAVKTLRVNEMSELQSEAKNIDFPIVMKVSGPVHKSDVGGVILNIRNENEMKDAYARMERIEGFEGVVIQPMISGTELFLGANYEDNFGHMIFCGLGGIFVEAIGDVNYGLAPLGKEEAISMIKSLRSVSILEGLRGGEGVDIDHFADIMVKLSNLPGSVPEIREMDLNPLMGRGKEIIVVDARIRIEKGE